MSSKPSASSSTVVIIGDGAMATVLAMLAVQNAASVIVWGRTPEQTEQIALSGENKRYLPGFALPPAIQWTSDSAVFGQLNESDLLVNAIPTQHIRSLWSTIRDAIPDGVPVLSVAKGIERETMLRPTEVLQQVLEGSVETPRHYATLSGPNIAEEIAQGQPAATLVASSHQPLAELAQQIFSTPTFRVYTHDDVLGVELAGALKNVIALAAGCLDGLQAGTNAKASLLARGLAEVSRLGVALGAQPQTFFGLAGVGDLATTCFAPTGRNRTCGQLLGEGNSLEQALAKLPGVVEGVPTTQATLLLAKKHNIDMPITAMLHAVLFDGVAPRDAIQQLMTRDPKPENLTQT